MIAKPLVQSSVHSLHHIIKNQRGGSRIAIIDKIKPLTPICFFLLHSAMMPRITPMIGKPNPANIKNVMPIKGWI